MIPSVEFIDIKTKELEKNDGERKREIVIS